MIPYVQHICASGTNARGLRHQSTSCWCAACAIAPEKSPNRKEIWREFLWFWQWKLTGKRKFDARKGKFHWRLIEALNARPKPPVRRLDAGTMETIDVNWSLIGLNWLNYISSSPNGYVLTYGTITVRKIAIYLLRRYKNRYATRTCICEKT
jgi:hypothetical protein